MAKLALDEVENIVGKRGNAGHQYFYFVHNVFEKLDFLGAFNPFPNKPWFLHVCSTCQLKTQREKEKLLVKSNFSFSHSVFYMFGEFSAIFNKFEIVVCKHFHFGRV